MGKALNLDLPDNFVAYLDFMHVLLTLSRSGRHDAAQTTTYYSTTTK